MTPNRAAEQMLEIVQNRGKRHALELGVALLCVIARRNGYYRAADIFEEHIAIPKDDE